MCIGMSVAGMGGGWVLTPNGHMGPGILRNTVDKRAVRIILECLLVIYCVCGLVMCEA